MRGRRWQHSRKRSRKQQDSNASSRTLTSDFLRETGVGDGELIVIPNHLAAPVSTGCEVECCLLILQRLPQLGTRCIVPDELRGVAVSAQALEEERPVLDAAARLRPSPPALLKRCGSRLLPRHGKQSEERGRQDPREQIHGPGVALHEQLH